MELIITSDGSQSIYSSKFDCTYHSTHGAIQESEHVFIKSGLDAFLLTNPVKTLKIFEMGFGTGSNAFLTFLKTFDRPISVEYTSVELYPLPEEVYSSLNYAGFINAEKHQADFLAMHKQEWNAFCTISPKFTLRKLNARLEEMTLDTTYHLVYFDAFDPVTQPELWTEAIFRKLFDAMEPAGILVTYSSKGQVRRNMMAAGFSVEKIQGPPGKREMLRAIKDISLHS